MPIRSLGTVVSSASFPGTDGRETARHAAPLPRLLAQEHPAVVVAASERAHRDPADLGDRRALEEIILGHRREASGASAAAIRLAPQRPRSSG
ncbi:MAG TPA: hypothetical protein VNA10_06030, partial [Thermoplasmata archaeon]|nr:hypothetical protein [Thermoplasmata archaeon]